MNLTIETTLRRLQACGLATLSSLILVAGSSAIHAQESAAASKEAAPPEDPGWPRVLEHEGTKITAYQPQIDDWSDYRTLKARLAFTLDLPDKDPVIGVASLTGQTTSNLDSRTVLIRDVKVTDARFPSLTDDEAAKMEAAFKANFFPKKSLVVSLDRMLAGTKISHENLKIVSVKTDPPPIYVSTSPAMLLIVEGKPALAPIEKTGLQFVINTNWDILFEPTSATYYLLSGDEWFSSKKLEDDWVIAGSLPDSLKKLPDDDTWKHVKASLPWAPKKGLIEPKVFFSDKPAELISFQGDPSWRSIEGTHLSWATNTDSHVFEDSEDGRIFSLFSGRWFSTDKLGGKWTYAGNDLPVDFLNIPSNDPSADVLASVPGAVEAEDAVLLASVPVEATIKKAEAQAKAKVTYNGEPDFQPIEGTSLQYGVNTSSDVVKFDGKYYLCQDAVWFLSAAATGPWVVCDEVPKEIYQIPASSPVYRTTYVTVEKSDDPSEAVYSYTAGYYGAFIAGMLVDECLVWGTGYYYPPYVAWGPYPAFYPYPRSYGVAAWYNPWTGGYAVGSRIYGPYGTAGRAAWYNPATGRYGRAARVEGPYGARTVAAGYNPRTNTGYVTHQGNNGYAQWGTSAVRRGDNWVRAGHINTANGGVARWQGSDGGGKFRWSDQGTSSIAVHNHDLYVGHDGNVYRHDPSGGWSKFENGGWQPRPGPDPNRPGANGGGIEHRPDLNRPGENGGGVQRPDLDRPGAGGDRPTRPGENGGGVQRPDADRPTTRPGENGGGVQRPEGNRPGSGGSGERQRPTDRIVDHKPEPKPAPERPSVDRDLDHESFSRQRGEQAAQRQQTFQRGGGNFGGGGGFQRGGGNVGGGGFQRGGGGGFRGGGGGFRGRR